MKQSKGTRLISPRQPVEAKPLGKNIFHIGRRSVPSIDRAPPVSVHFRDASKPKTSTQWYIVTGHFFITPPVIHAREYRIRKSSEHATIRFEARLHSFSPARFSSLSRSFKPGPGDPIEISRESR